MAQAGTSSGDWQTGLKYLGQRASHILSTGQWSDCSFLVGNENNQKTIQGHRLILAMSSPVFEAMFFGGLAEKSEKPIEILDVQPEAFRALLQYIYSDEINLRSFDQVCEICYAAKKYMIPSLVEQCTQFIWGDLYPGNVCRAYEFALLFEEPRLIEKCLQIIEKKTDEVLNDPSFEEMGLSTLRTILQQDTLNVSESVLWDALLSWTKQECVRQSLEVNPENQRKVLGDCFSLVRLLTLKPSEFANGPAVSGLLTQEESFSLLMNISSPGVASLPSSICKNNKSRQKLPTPPKTESSSMMVQLPARKWCACGGEVADILINEQLVDCSLSFSVNNNVSIHGMLIPSQILPENMEQHPSHQPRPLNYSELIYSFLQDSDCCRLTYTHFTARVPWNSSVEVLFNRPVIITPNKTYKIVVVLNKVGRYPLFHISPQVHLDHIMFTFGREGARDGLGLIRAIIFDPPS